MTSCYRCKSTDIIIDRARGDHICRTCGEVVVSRLIDESSEWVSYADDDRNRADMSRTSSYNSDNVWSEQTVFVGGSESQRSSLQKSQLMTENVNKIKVARSLDEVNQLAGRMNLSPAVSVSIRYNHVCLFYPVEIFNEIPGKIL